MPEEIREIRIAQLKHWLDNTDITYEQLIEFMNVNREIEDD